MRVAMVVTTLTLGWIAWFILGFYSYAVGHSSMSNPTPWLPWVGLGWLIVTATLVTIAVVRAVYRSDDEEAARRTEEIRSRRLDRFGP